MAAPCINETCSITAEINPIDRRLEMNVRVDPNGGLICADGLGLGVELMSPTRELEDACFNQLGLTSPGGALYSIPARAKAVRRQGVVVNIKQDATTADPSDNSLDGLDITNPFDCEAEVIIFCQHRIGFTITSGGPNGAHDHPIVTDGAVSGGKAGGVMIPYGMQVRCEVSNIGIGNFANGVVFRDFGGLVPEDLDNTNRRDISYTVSRRRMGGGAVLPLVATAQHQINTANQPHWFNVQTTNPVAPFLERGYTASVLAVIFPFNSEDV